MDLADFSSLSEPLVFLKLINHGGSTATYHFELPKIEDVVGTRGADHIEGSDGPNVLAGFGGDDELLGHSARDELIGGSGADVADGADGFDGCSAETTVSCERAPATD